MVTNTFHGSQAAQSAVDGKQSCSQHRAWHVRMDVITLSTTLHMTLHGPAWNYFALNSRQHIISRQFQELIVNNHEHSI